MNYSSVIGHDLANNDVFLHSVVSEEINQIFLSNADKFESVMDFGGGIFGITVAEVLEKYPSATSLRKFIGFKTITKDESLELYDALVAARGDRSYLI